MESPPPFLRNALKEFRAVGESLGKQTKLDEDEASRLLLSAGRNAEVAQQVALACWQRIQEQDLSSADLPSVQCSPEVDEELRQLKILSTEIQQCRGRLRQSESRLQSLKKELEQALEAEHSARVRRNLIRIGAGFAAVFTVIALHFWLLSKTTLSFAISVDGKQLRDNQSPQVALDGKPFVSGDKIKLGRHHLSIELQKHEPFQRDFWAFYGGKDFGALNLEHSQGSLSVSVTPSPAKVVVQSFRDTIQEGEAPLKVSRLPVGNYSLHVSRGEYEESHSVTIGRQHLTETNIVLNLGGAQLSSKPPDAAFELSNQGRSWQGKLPAQIEAVPAGTYRFIAKRNGWELDTYVDVKKGQITAKEIEFLYGSLEITSEPSGLMASTNGVVIGKTPITLRELKPGDYTLIASDGENDLTANIIVSPNESARHVFVFHYVTLQVSSKPNGAIVIRKGKEIGKTPMTLDHIPAGDTTLELQLQDYLSTNLSVHAVEGVVSTVSTKLISTRYLAHLSDANAVLRTFTPNYFRAVEYLDQALAIEPEDSEAIRLRDYCRFRGNLVEASKALENGNLDAAKKAITTLLAQRPTDPEALALKTNLVVATEQREQLVRAQKDQRERSEIMQSDQRSDERARAASREFDQVMSDVAKRCGTSDTAETKTAVWRAYTTPAKAREVLLARIARTGQWKVKTERHPTPGVTVICMTPPGTVLVNKTLEDNQFNFVAQITELPNGDLDIRARMVTGLMFDKDPAGYKERRSQLQAARLQAFDVDYGRDMQDFLTKPAKAASSKTP